MTRLYLLFILSGFAGLVLETVFVRQLAWLFGNGTIATVVVLSAFMGGLALGAALLGPVADRAARPLRMYGMLEIGAAASAAALAQLLGAGRHWFLALLRGLDAGPLSGVAEFLLASLLLLVPTVLMGGTLPALSRLVIRDLSRFSHTLGLLYAVNTLGAAAGVFLSGFYLIEWLGVSRTALTAAGIQLLVGIAALLLDRVWDAGPVGRPSRPAPEVLAGAGADRTGTPTRTPRAGESALPTVVRRACLVAAGVAGFAILGYEVLWTRLLSLYMRSFTYSFSLMLSLFLGGLVIGSAILAWAGPRIRHPARLLAWLQLATALYVASMPLWLAGRLTPVPASSFGEFLAKSGLRTALMVLPPTILSGLSLPLAARSFARNTAHIGGDVGLVFGVNTVGAILGAMVAGLVLLPFAGAAPSLVLLAILQALAGTVVLLALGRSGLQALLACALTLVCAIPLLGGNQRFVDAFLAASRSAERIGELLYFRESATDTVAIVRREYGFHDPQAKSLITNGIAMAATVKPVWRYMAAEGHLPVLFSRNPRRAILIGAGTGITLGALASHPGLETIDVVELSPGVIEGLEWFERENGGAARDPRVRLIQEDGRHRLEMNLTDYDLITLEPPPPIVAGATHLYSRDFYDICRRRLRPGGVVTQWLPLHAQSLASARMTARTFVDAFPHAQLWLPSIRDAVLIGSVEPLSMSLDRLTEAFRRPRTRDNLRAAYLESPEALLGTFLLDRRGIEAWVAGAPPITDEHPRMEFFRHQGSTMKDAEIATLLGPPQGDWSYVAGIEQSPGLLARLERENTALRSYVRGTVEKDGQASIAAVGLSAGTEFFRYPFGCTSAQLARLRAPGFKPRPNVLAAHLERCASLPQVPAGVE